MYSPLTNNLWLKLFIKPDSAKVSALLHRLTQTLQIFSAFFAIIIQNCYKFATGKSLLIVFVVFFMPHHLFKFMYILNFYVIFYIFLSFPINLG